MTNTYLEKRKLVLDKTRPKTISIEEKKKGTKVEEVLDSLVILVQIHYPISTYILKKLDSLESCT